MKIKKVMLSIALLSISLSSVASEKEVCQVQVCNKLERFTLDFGSMIMDSLGETCQDVMIDKRLAVVDKVLTSESRWYQGSNINPTKKSVTRVKTVYQCFTLSGK